MLNTNTHTIAKVLKVEYKIIKNVKFVGVTTDTRKPVSGTLFLALVGDNFDGHDYISEAEKKGAVAIIANKPLSSGLVVIVVKDTQKALVRIANWHLNNISPVVIAITGSNGKTTTKNMLYNILSLKAPTIATKGNLNNNLGVPFTLLNLAKKHIYAVIEMGADHVGEIAYLCTIAKPHISAITNANNAHIGKFGSFENLVKTKGEIYEALDGNGVAIINNNLDCATKWRARLTTQKVVSFGNNSKIFATNIMQKRNYIYFNLHISTKQQKIVLNMLGKHQVDNALVATACAHALNIDITTIKQGLQNTEAAVGRLKIIHCGKLTIIDDSYNANPHSMKAAINTLAGFTGEKVLVLGPMADLGKDSLAWHQQIGKLIDKKNITAYAYGVLANVYGFSYFVNLKKLKQHIIKKHHKAVILVKGSRIAGLDKLVKMLQNKC